MPLEDYAGMTDADLGSIYDFLAKTIPQVKQSVLRFEPPKLLKRLRTKALWDPAAR